ncbi:MAG: RIP metalloprotease RseP [Phototrophicales bacterium]|nr:MAG: RIP metalloprotease RseP [Phototrophicales bacterium]
MSITLMLISFIFALIPLVIIHELGHFFAAKSVGITVLEFGIGFPPKAATLFVKGDTEYTLNWLPLGGFVRPYGEDFVAPQSPEVAQAALAEIEGRKIENPKSVFEAGPWERIWFFIAGPLFNFIAAFLIFVLIGFTGIPETVAEVSVAEVFSGSSAEAAGLRPGDVITHVDNERVERVSQFEEATRGKEQYTLTIKRDKEIIDDVLVKPMPFAAEGIESRVLILDVLEDSPADQAGLLPDDVVLAVDGEPVKDINFLSDYTDAREGQPIVFTVARGDETFELTITPEKIDGDVRVGITIAAAPLDDTLGAVLANRDAKTITRTAGAGEALSYGATMFWRTISLMASFPSQLISGELSAQEARPVSPVGVSQIGGQVLEQSIEESVVYPFLGFMALISIALAVTNLLPIPGLDGGRILFVVIELLRGKPMEPEREGVVHIIGLLFLLSLMAIVVVMDIINPITLN